MVVLNYSSSEVVERLRKLINHFCKFIKNFIFYSISVTNRLVTLRETDPELAEMVVKQLYHAAMANAGLNDDAVSISNKTNELVQLFLEKI